ncbi:unnamed protein product [Allacma fusca]|uniref:Derlin n=1 Tax=Allacma fusca TaxID=39272 RepID=A0A8J2PBU0_9HEXA|nr:unnamed protein product [Allacma fusca]
MDEVSTWFNSLPRFTRYWFGGTVSFSLLARFGILSPRYLVLLYDLFIKEFQIWRPATALFFYPISPQTGFHFLINLYFLINYSKLLETGVFATRPADYATMLLFNWAVCVVTALFMNMMTLMDPMVLSVLYVWCQLNKDVTVNFWFGTQFKAMYLPWVLFGFNLILSGGGMSELIGILVGHLYFFLKFQYPQQYGGPPLLGTPSILENWFPPPRGGMGGFGIPPEARAPAGASPAGNPAGPAGGGRSMFGGHSWGRGQQLGNQ